MTDANQEPHWHSIWLQYLVEQFSSLKRLSSSLAALPRLPLWLWLSVAAAIAFWRGWQSIRFSRTLNSARTAPAAVQTLVDECATLIGLRTAPIAHLVAQRVSPLILCFPKPRLIIPVELWAELDADGRRVVILHELAHLKRRDHWTHWFNEFLGAVYWWHPLVWWMRHRVADEAENACDMWVTWLAPKSRRAYATALVQAQQFLNTSATPTPASAVGILSPQAQRIARRLTMIMTHRNTPRSSTFGFLCVPALLLAAWVAAPAHSQTPDVAEIDVIAVDTPQPPTAVVVGTGAGEVLVAPAVPDAPHVIVAAGAAHDHPDHADEHADGHGHEGRGRARVRRRASGADQERLARLEAQIARLAEQVERLSNQRDRKLLPPPAPNAEMLLRQQYSAGAQQPALKLKSTSPQHTITRRYKLPEGKREAMNKLMSRSDVPVLMRPRPDGIEVIATKDQHRIFARFVRMISGEGMDHKKTYEVTGAQMDDLAALMARDDVPVLVSPHKNKITVHGNELIQDSFREFIEMIAPKGTKAHSGLRTAAPAAVAGEWQYAVDARRSQEVAAAARREAMIAREYAQVRNKMAKAQEELRRRARELETQADRMQVRAEEIALKLRQVSELRKRIDDEESIVELDTQIAELRSAKRAIEKEAEELFDEASEAEAEIEELEDEMDELGDE